MTLGRLALRTTVGGLFVGHGAQKLFGWFGGGGLDATAGMFGSIGMRPPKAHAVAAGVGEAAGGAGLALGLAGPLPNAVIIATMLTAIRTVHGKNGPWATQGGWEYNAVLIAACAALAEDGEDTGVSGPLLALALGVAGAAAAKLISDRSPEPTPEPATADVAAPDPSPVAAPPAAVTPEPASADAAEAPSGDSDSSA